MSSSGHCEDDDWRPYSHKHRDLRAVFEQSRQALEIPEKKLLRALVYHAVLDMQKVYGETAAQARRWFADCSENVWGFGWVTQILGLDPSRFRREAQRLEVLDD